MSLEDKVNILIVDDRPEQRLSLNAILGDLGENLVEVGSGKEALRELLHRDFAVILLDVNMPGMDGFDTAALIRQRRQSANTPIIFITAYGDDTHASRGYSLGAVDYILSPVDAEVLKTKVGVFTALYRTTLEVKRQAEALRERTLQLRKLTEASLAIHSAPSIEQVLEVVTRTGASIVDSHQAATILSVSQNGGGTKGVHWLSEKYAAWQSAEAKIVGLPTPSFDSGKPIRLTPAELEQLPAWNLRNADLPMRGWLAAPLTGGDGRLVGSIQLSDKRSGDFTEDDEAIVVQLAQMAAIAIENVLSGEIREANRLKDEFLSTLSHELRTPLQAVLTWVRLLRSEKADAAMIARGLEVIERCARAQAGLIEDVLDVSRIVAGRVRVEPRLLELRKLATAAIETVSPAAAAKEIEINSNLGSSTCQVSGDPVRLQQVFGNLLSNAVKFTPKGGRIEIRLDESEREAAIAISDNGKGIAVDFLPHIFERFRQADSTTTRAHGGLGLGLAIARHLVELHGGTLKAESAGEGRGATFTVGLPKTTQVESAATANEATSRVHVAAVNGFRLNGVRVLLVDDERDTRDSLALALEEEGAQVLAVSSAAEALAAVERAAPDVLVSDIGMPGQDGYALIRELRAREQTRGGRVPAAALSAYVRPEDRARALRCGYDLHVQKPTTPGELAAAIKSLTRRPEQPRSA